MGDRPTVIVIYCSEDGEKSMSERDEAEFLAELAQHAKDGEKHSFAPSAKVDLDYFTGYIVIKGRVVVPNPTEVALKYEL